jgi:hypothetical protein
MNRYPSAAAALAAALLAGAAQADIRITEVAPWGSGQTASYAADWFELTNTGSSAVNISNWKMDDNSNAVASAVALRGVTSIAAGQSVIFLEGTATGTTDASINASFIAAWFNGAAPAGFTVGNYGGSGVGLSATSDAVNIFDATGALVTRVDFGASTTGRSFDNTVGLNNVTLTLLSTVGVNGAFTSFNGAEAGSPGVAAAVPEPAAWALMLAGVAGLIVLRRTDRNGRDGR